MTLTGETPNSTWKDSDGEVVQIPDNLNDLSEHIRSVLKTAEIADVNTVLNGLGHEDVTLHINSKTDDQIRKVTFGLEIRNWKEHTGGKSAYSESDLVDYDFESGDSELPDYMYLMGAFFHKLENKISDIFRNSKYSKPMFKLENHDKSSVVFEGSREFYRYDGL